MIIIVLALLGLCFGSFVNAFVWRLKTKKDWVKGRSECLLCHHLLSALDLIPVLSWLALKGKCRYCHKPISWQYPLVEIATTALFVTSYIYWPSTIYHLPSTILFGLWLALLVIFVALVIYDIRWMVLPDKLTRALAILAAVFLLIRVEIADKSLEVIIGGALGLLALGGLFYLLFQASNGRWIGGGDVKLGFSLGLIVGGPLNALLVIFIASSLGCFIAIPLLAAGKLKKTSRLPFGPFLIAATVLVFLFGNRLVSWYFNLLPSF